MTSDSLHFVSSESVFWKQNHFPAQKINFGYQYRTDALFNHVLVWVVMFRTIDEAIERANKSQYGLASGIVTNDLNVANTVARSVRAGTVWINCYLAFDPDCPYGGYKMSGFGRSLGLHALHNYLQVKSVVTPVHNSPWL